MPSLLYGLELPCGVMKTINARCGVKMSFVEDVLKEVNALYGQRVADVKDCKVTEPCESNTAKQCCRTQNVPTWAEIAESSNAKVKETEATEATRVLVVPRDDSYSCCYNSDGDGDGDGDSGYDSDGDGDSGYDSSYYSGGGYNRNSGYNSYSDGECNPNEW